MNKKRKKTGTKLAVVFPGIGYHVDKPLLYYAKKMVKAYDYEVIEVPYGHFKKNMKGSKEKMEEAFISAFSQAEEILKKTDFAAYDHILFISKSIGTAVAAAYAQKYHLKTGNLYYTPVEVSFPLIENKSGIVFHGTKDLWIQTELVRQECEEKLLPLYITEGANHSLETGNLQKDLENLQIIMEKSEKYVEEVIYLL